MKSLATLLLLFFINNHANAGFSASDEMMLKAITSECLKAAEDYRKVIHDVAYKVLHTSKYKGLSGNKNNFQLNRFVFMNITFAGNNKKGVYWFKDSPDIKYPITVKNDFQGNIELYNNHNNETFTGKMIDGDIIGVWKNAEKTDSYAFYLERLDE